MLVVLMLQYLKDFVQESDFSVFSFSPWNNNSRLRQGLEAKSMQSHKQKNMPLFLFIQSVRYVQRVGKVPGRMNKVDSIGICY